MPVSPIPTQHQRLLPHLTFKSGSEAIAFYERAFGAVEVFRLTEPSGKLGHAEVDMLGARIMLNDEYPDFGALSPVSLGGSPISLLIYVEDVDAVVARAVEAGAELLRPIKQEFYGDRTAMLADPFGYRWRISTRVEDVSPAEMQRRMDAAYS